MEEGRHLEHAEARKMKLNCGMKWKCKWKKIKLRVEASMER